MMYITFEISRPVQLQPRVMWLPNVRLFVVEWLLFAFHFNPSYTPSQLVAAARAATRCEMSADVEAAQARIAELEAQIAKWKEFTGVDEPSWDATLPAPRFATLPIILSGVGKSTADVTYDWKPAKSASDND